MFKNNYYIGYLQTILRVQNLKIDVVDKNLKIIYPYFERLCYYLMRVIKYKLCISDSRNRWW